MKQVICKSGIKGWQCKLQTNYRSFEDFEAYCNIYNLHKRLGYNTPISAWYANPTIQGSTNPRDFRKVK